MALQRAGVLSGPRKLLEMQNLGLHSRTSEFETVGRGSEVVVRIRPQGDSDASLSLRITGLGVKPVDSGASAQMLVMPLTGCVSSGKSPYLSVPPGPYL